MRRTSLEEGMRWLEQAKEDLKWARHLAQQGGYHIACFLAQQVAEKALKAYLYGRGLEIVTGHSIARLGADASQLDREFTSKVKRWAILDSYYITARYPNGLPDSIPALVFDRETAEKAVDLAAEAVQFVENKLGVQRGQEKGKL